MSLGTSIKRFDWVFKSKLPSRRSTSSPWISATYHDIVEACRARAAPKIKPASVWVCKCRLSSGHRWNLRRHNLQVGCALHVASCLLSPCCLTKGEWHLVHWNVALSCFSKCSLQVASVGNLRSQKWQVRAPVLHFLWWVVNARGLFVEKGQALHWNMMLTIGHFSDDYGWFFLWKLDELTFTSHKIKTIIVSILNVASKTVEARP